MPASTVRRLNGTLVLLFGLVSAAVWSHLPEQIPVHFGFRGQPDAWARASFLSWFGLPITAAGMALFLWWAGRLANRPPALWNMPEKQEFLRLPPEARQRIETAAETYLAWVSVCTTVLLIAIQVGIYMTATGYTAGLSSYIALVLFAGIAVILAGALLLNRRLKREILDASNAADFHG